VPSPARPRIASQAFARCRIKRAQRTRWQPTVGVVRQALATAGALVNQEGEALAPKCLCESSVGRPATASSERSKPSRSPAALPTCAASMAWNLIRAARWSTMMVSRADYAFAAVLAVAAARCCAASAFAEVVTCSDRRDRSRSNARARPSMRYCTDPWNRCSGLPKGGKRSGLPKGGKRFQDRGHVTEGTTTTDVGVAGQPTQGVLCWLNVNAELD
jgi:hypothetical protein